MGGGENGPEPTTQSEVSRAISRLPARQRQAFELRELERLRYEEIAARLGTSHDSVAKLIARARINLYDELRGTPLASIAAPFPECERALPLIAAREDGQLDVDSSAEATWLEVHLADCDRCRPAVEQMAEATASYHAWKKSSARKGQSPAQNPSRRRIAIAATSLAALLLAGAVAALVANEDTPSSGEPAAEVSAAGPSHGESSPREKAGSVKRKKGAKSKPEPDKRAAAKTSPSTDLEVAASPDPAEESGPGPTDDRVPSEQAAGPKRSSGEQGIDPPKQASAPSSPSSKPKSAPISTQTSQPAPVAPPVAPPVEPAPPAEEPSDSPGRSGEAPGKQDDHRPPRK